MHSFTYPQVLLSLRWTWWDFLEQDLEDVPKRVLELVCSHHRTPAPALPCFFLRLPGQSRPPSVSGDFLSLPLPLCSAFLLLCGFSYHLQPWTNACSELWPQATLLYNFPTSLSTPVLKEGESLFKEKKKVLIIFPLRKHYPIIQQKFRICTSSNVFIES